MDTTLGTTRADHHRGRQIGRRPIRVLQIITRINVGGTSCQVIYVTQRLQDADFKCALLAGNVGPHEGSMESLAFERNVQLIRAPHLGREISPKADLLTIQHLYREMRRLQPDIVHTHQAKAGALGRLAARMARVPVVLHTYHGHIFHGYFSRRKTELILATERALGRWTDRIVVLGEAQEQEILGLGVGRREQMVQIPYGLELEPFLRAAEHRGVLRAELGTPARRPLLGIIGRLVPIKAHDLFLAAAQRVALTRPGAQFVVVGDGELRVPLEEQALSLGFEVISHHPGQPANRRPAPRAKPLSASAVHFLGFRTDLAAIYADLDVVVLSSLNEGLPITIIEALAAARPVVATDVGAVSDLVVPGETGWLVPCGDAAGLAAAMLRHLDDPTAAASMGRRGRQRVHPHLSIDRLEQDFRRLYAELADAKRLMRSKR